MANSYKDIIITPNRSNTADPRIEFRGGNTSTNTAITIQTYATSNGTLSFEGSAGQLFSITNDLTGSIFSVNDVSGIPSIEVFANGQINLAEYGGRILIGNTATFAANTISATDMTLSGNLTVSGTTTYINTTTLNVGDNIITLNADVTSGTAPSQDAGIEINRGSSANVQFVWDETNDRWSTGSQPLALSSLVAAGAVSGVTTLAAGNTTITGFMNASVSVNTASFTIGSNFIANTTGAYHTGLINAASFTIGSSLIANTTGAYHTGLINAASFNVGTSLIANTTGLTTTIGANAINLTNATSNWIYWNTSGVGAPAVTTRSVGTKLVIYPAIASGSVDYGIGIEGSHLWFSAASTTAGFKWYSNTVNILTANTTGLNLNTTALSGVTTAAMGNTTISGFANVSGTIQGGSSLTIAGAASGITTLGAGNTTITGFANVTTSVNSALITVGSSFIANTTGAYHTGTVNAPIFRDSNDTAFYFDPANTGTSLQVAGAVEYGNNFAHPNVEWSASGASTGEVIFYLPGTTANYGMVHMVFDIYEYITGKTATVIIGGHNWTTPGWFENSCQVIGWTDKTIRLGVKNDGTNNRFCVVFGGTTSTWSYGTIRLRKVNNGGFYNNTMDLGGNWSAFQTTTETFVTITGDLRQLRTSANMTVDGNLRVGYSPEPSVYNINIVSRSPGSGIVDWDFSTNDATFGARTPMTIKSNGNIGIGTNNPIGKLSVEMGNASSSGATSGLTAWDNTYALFGVTGTTTSSAVGIGYNSSTGGSLVSLGPSVAWRRMNYLALEHRFYRDGSTEALQIDSGSRLISYAPMVAWNATIPGQGRGSLHIGTASATTDAGGSVTFEARDATAGTAQAGIYINSGGTYGTRMYFATTNNYNTGSITAMSIDAVGVITANRDSFRAPVFYDSANTAYYLDPASTGTSLSVAGSAGIGTTSPSQQLDVTVSSGTEGSGLAITNSLAGGYGSGVNFYSFRSDGTTKIVAGAIHMYGQNTWSNTVNTSSNMRFYVVNSNTLNEYMRITAAGSVGIGTTGPQLKFVVSNGGASGLELDPTAVASSPLIQAYNRSGAAYMQLTFDALLFVWRPGGTERMRLTNAGNLEFGSATRQMVNLWSTTYGIGVQNSTEYFRTDGRFSWFRGGSHVDTENTAGSGGTVAMTLDSSSNLIVTGEVQGTLFRDTANSSFYVDPAGISALNEIRPAVIRYSDGTNAMALNNATYTLIYDRSGRTAIYLGGSGDQNNYYDNTNHYFRNTTGATLYATIGSSGVVAPAFYDSANTVYVADPASTSRLNAISLDTMVVTSGLSGLTTAPIITQENNIGTTASWMPLTHQKALYTSGYRTHLSTGLYKTADAWGSGTTGWYAAIGGNDSYPTQAWYLTYDAVIKNSLGYIITDGSFRAPLFYDSANTAFYVDLNAGSNVSGEFNIAQNSAGGLKITSTTGSQAFWARTGFDTNGTGTPAVSALNVMLQSSGSSAGTFTFVCGNTLALTVLGDYAQGAGSLRAPVFYDTSNTAFFGDFGSATVAASLNGRILGGFGADSTSGTTDWNHSTNSRSGSGATLLLGTDTNGPGGSIYFHPFNFEYSSKDGTGNITQFAVPYGTPANRLAMRGRYDGAWTGWAEFITNIAAVQTFNGIIVGRVSPNTNVNTANDAGSISLRGNTSTIASMSFHRVDAYAINMGLGTDNVFRIGGWSAANNCFQMDGSGNLTMLGNVTAYSDERQKKDVETITDAIEIVKSLRGVRYTRIDNDERGIGVIAQEVQKILPEVVQAGVGDDDTLSVAYGNMVGVLIEAIKEQQAYINTLETKIQYILDKLEDK